MRLDESVHHRISRKSDEVSDPFALAILIYFELSKCSVTPKPKQNEARPIPLHNRIEEGYKTIG